MENIQNIPQPVIVQAEKGIEIVTRSTTKKAFPYNLVKVKLTFVGGREDDEDKLHALSTITTNINRFQKEVYSKITKDKKRKFIPDIAEGVSGDKIQRTFSISFDYTSKDTLADFIRYMEDLKKAKPIYEISFGLKDADRKYDEVLKEATINAKNRARAIADGAGSQIQRCLKIEYDERSDMREAEGKLASNPLLAENYEVPAVVEESDDKAEVKMESRMSSEIIRHIRETFVPEEVEISATVKCIWLAE